jgi:hypothetical protein
MLCDFVAQIRHSFVLCFFVPVFAVYSASLTAYVRDYNQQPITTSYLSDLIFCPSISFVNPLNISDVVVGRCRAHARDC